MMRLVECGRVLRAALAKRSALRSAYHAGSSLFSRFTYLLASISQGYRDPRDPWRRYYYINPAKHGERLKKGTWYRPLLLQLETVNTCNNLCVICAYESQDRPKSVMTMRIFERGICTDYS